MSRLHGFILYSSLALQSVEIVVMSLYALTPVRPFRFRHFPETFRHYDKMSSPYIFTHVPNYSILLQILALSFLSVLLLITHL